MKRTFTAGALSALLSLFCLPCFSQTVDNVDLSSIDATFIEVTGYSRAFGTKLVISVDYGQKFKFGAGMVIKDTEGKEMKFNSMMDALNFILRYGWEYTNSYYLQVGNNTEYHYLLKRKE